MQSKLYKKVPEYIYELWEFQEESPDIDPTPWREWDDDTEWISIPENKVCRILSRVMIGKNEYIVTICGKYSKAMSKFNPVFGDPTNFGGKRKVQIKSVITPHERDLQVKMVAEAFFLDGKNGPDAYTTAFPYQKGRNENFLMKRFAHLMKYKGLEGIIKTIVQDALKENNITPDYVLKNYKKFLKNTMIADNPTIALKANDALKNILDMDPKEESLEEVEFVEFSDKQKEIAGIETKQLDE